MNLRVCNRLLAPAFLAAGLVLPAAATAQNDGPSMAEAQAMDAHGPRARIAVARFENKAGNTGRWYSPAIGDGMADMLTTALFNSGRFIVVERQAVDDVLAEQDLGASGRVRDDTAAAIGEIEGAELLVVAAVTEFAENASGRSGSVGGGRLGRAIGAIAGSTSSAHMAIDLRVIDARTSRVLAATSVEGEAKDFDIGGALAGYTSRHSLGGSLSAWENTPREKALRQVIGKAVNVVVSNTPDEYYRHGGGRQQSTGSQSAGGGERLVITAESVNAHRGPNAQTSVAFTLDAGTFVEISARAGDWVQIHNEDGEAGWITQEHAMAVQ